MGYQISFYRTTGRPNEPLRSGMFQRMFPENVINLPPDMDAATASMVQHQINEALSALLDASILDCSVRAILD